MESLFIKEETWEAYAETIAYEDMELINEEIDEGLLEDSSINLNEITLTHTIG